MNSIYRIVGQVGTIIGSMRFHCSYLASAVLEEGFRDVYQITFVAAAESPVVLYMCLIAKLLIVLNVSTIALSSRIQKISRVPLS